MQNWVYRSRFLLGLLRIGPAQNVTNSRPVVMLGSGVAVSRCLAEPSGRVSGRLAVEHGGKSGLFAMMAFQDGPPATQCGLAAAKSPLVLAPARAPPCLPFLPPCQFQRDQHLVAGVSRFQTSLTTFVPRTIVLFTHPSTVVSVAVPSSVTEPREPAPP